MACENILDPILSYFSHLVVSLWHNEWWGLLLGEEGEVKDVGDGHLPGLGVHHLSRHSCLNVVILQWSKSQNLGTGMKN